MSFPEVDADPGVKRQVIARTIKGYAPDSRHRRANQRDLGLLRQIPKSNGGVTRDRRQLCSIGSKRHVHQGLSVAP